jgi:hypothetical protein
MRSAPGKAVRPRTGADHSAFSMPHEQPSEAKLEALLAEQAHRRVATLVAADPDA